MSERPESFISALSSVIFRLLCSPMSSFWLWFSLHLFSRLYGLNFEATGMERPETVRFGFSGYFIFIFCWYFPLVMSFDRCRSICWGAESSR